MERRTASEKKGRKACGFWAGLARKMGLAPSAPAGSGASLSFGLPELGADAAFAGRAGAWSLLAGSAGPSLAVVALTAGLLLGSAGLSMFHSRLRAAGATGPWSRFPKRPTVAELSPETARADGASASLDYMAKAAKDDPLLDKSRDADAPKAGVASVGLSVSAPGAPVGEKAAAPADAAPSSPSAGAAARPAFQRVAGFANAGKIGGMRDAVGTRSDAASPSRVFNATSSLRPGAKPAPIGQGAVLRGRGGRTSDMLLSANRDGLAQKSSSNPNMTRAGATFDGSNGLGGSTLGDPVMSTDFGGLGGSDGSVEPDSVIDQKSVDVPSPAPVDQTKDDNPYQWAMVAAMAALAAAALLMMMAGSKKDEAKSLTGAQQAEALNSAANLHYLAAAAAGLAAAMGMVIMAVYQQAQQGMIFVGAGGLLAIFNIKAASDLSKGSQDADATRDKAMEGIEANDGQISQNLTGAGDVSGTVW